MGEMLISVIIPVYNREERIRTAVNSVLNQPCANHIEIVLVDDGSKDQSGAICDELAKKNKNILVYHNENGGAATARNYAIERANGKYIIPLDSDDRWDDNIFDEQLCAKLRQENTDIYGFGVRFCSPNGKHKKEKMPYVDAAEILGPGNTKESEVMHWSLCYRRRMILDHEIRYPEIKLLEDAFFVRAACCCARSYHGIETILYNYNIDYRNAADDAVVFQESFNGAVAFNQWAQKHCPNACISEREQLSNIVRFIPRYSALHSYEETISFFSQPKIATLMDSELLPWSNLQATYEHWNSNQRAFWLKSKIKYFFPYWMKNHRNEGPLKNLKSFVWYHWVKKTF